MGKKRRTEAPKKPRGSKIFSPFRALGNVSNEIPHAIGTLGATFYIVTSVGRSFQIYDAATLHLLFVSSKQTPSKITALAAHFHHVYVAYGTRVGIFKRGTLEAEVSVPIAGTSTITHILVFGEYLVVVSSDGDVNVFKKPRDSRLPTDHYTTLKSINPEFDGPIVGLVHPPTYLNKVVVATSSRLYLFNIRTAKTVFRSDDAFDHISSIQHAPVLDIVAVGTTTGSVFLYNLRKGSVLDNIAVAPLEAPAKVVSVSFRTDGSHHMVAGLNSGDLFFYDLSRRARVHVYRDCHSESSGGVAAATFLNGQPIVVTNGGDNHLKELVFDPPLSTSSSAVISPPRHLRLRGGHSAPPVAMVFPNEDKSHFVYSASKDRTVWTFSLRKDAQALEMSQRPPKTNSKERKGGLVALMREKFPEVTGMAMSVAREGDWENMLTTHKNETFARTWDTKNKRVGRYDLNTVDGGIAKAICVSQCGNFGLIGSANGGIGVYNLQSGLLRRRYMLHKKCVTGIAIDGMNRKMVSSGLDGIVGFYNFHDLKYLGKVQLDAPVTALEYHKGSDLVACALDDLSIVVLDAVTQKVVRILYGHTNRITAMDFSPDGRWIVSAGLDGTLRTWDLPTGGCIDGIRLPSVATGVRFTPIGDFLATTHVAGNGISLWTNRAQFHPVSTRHTEEHEFATVLLPNVSGEGGSSLIDGALETAELDPNQTYHLVDQIDKSLLTLSVGPRSKYQGILHVDIIKQRNKPKEAPKKPDNAPFFLSLSGEAVGDRASVAENGAKEANGPSNEEQLRLLELRPGDERNFESDFTRLLREGHKSGDYTIFLSYLLGASPATIDLELRSMNTFPPLDEMVSFVEAMTHGLALNTNFDILEAVFGLFLKHHGDVIYASLEPMLVDALDQWAKVNSRQGDHLDELVKYCSGVADFLTAV